MTPSVGPTLLTGVKLGEEDRLVDDLMEWERKLENASLCAVPSKRSADCSESSDGSAHERVAPFCDMAIPIDMPVSAFRVSLNAESTQV